MAKARKVPYYTMESSVWGGKTWKENAGTKGAVPINTPQKVSFSRPAPGTEPAHKREPTPPAPGQIRQQKPKVPQQKNVADQAEKKQQQERTQPTKPLPEILDAEEHQSIPEFDLQDIAAAMDKIGWPMSAKMARRWFSGPAFVETDGADPLQSLDDTSVSLAWALKYGNAKRRLDQLLSKLVYSPNAQHLVKEKISKRLNEVFRQSHSTRPPLSFDTAQFLSDLRQFHSDWQFQWVEVSLLDTLDGVLMTDLSGALGNFNLYAAIGSVNVSGERYYRYDQKPYEFCYEPTVEITHVYVYLKDSYSFNDKKDSAKSQYLGHWNKADMILSYNTVANFLINSRKLDIASDKVDWHINWEYFSKNQTIEKPLDTRKSFFKKLVPDDVYYPVYNSTFKEWRDQHQRGEDFLIFSKPRLYKLKKSISFKLNRLCRPYVVTSTAP